MFIYLITNHITDKQYIGMTYRKGKNFDKYWGSGKLIQNSINRYGLDNFTKEILQICFNRQELFEAEMYWIKKLKTLIPNGYNISPGGRTYANFDEEGKQIFCRNRLIANPDMYLKAKETRLRNGSYILTPTQHQECIERNRRITQNPVWRAKIKEIHNCRSPKELRYYIQNTLTNEVVDLINIRGVKKYIYEYNEMMGYKNNKRCNHHLLCHLGHTRDFIMLKKESAHYAK